MRHAITPNLARSFRTLLSAACAALALAAPARADTSPSPLNRGISPRPRAELTVVAMRSETVAMVLGKTRMSVKATFHMENPGPDTAFEVGFPLAYQDEIHDFAAAVDGVAVATTLHEVKSPRVLGGESTSWWLVWPMRFAAGKKSTIAVAYWVVPSVKPFAIRGGMFADLDKKLGEGVLDGLEQRGVGYILESGAPWGGPIGSARIAFQLTDGLTLGHLREVTPAPTRREGTTLEWTFADLEPTFDIAIDFHPALTLTDEIALFRKAAGVPQDGREDIACHLHLVDLLRLAGDPAAVLATYEGVLDRVAAEPVPEDAFDYDGLEAVLEAIRHLIGDDAARADPAALARRAAKGLAVTERWLPLLRGAVETDASARSMVDQARIIQVLCLKALGKSARDVVKDLHVASACGRSMEIAPASAALVALEAEVVRIEVGATSSTYDATYTLRGLAAGTVTAKLWGDLDPREVELVRMSDGAFDNLQATVDGKPVAIGVVEIPAKLDPGDEPWNERFVGWTFEVAAGAAVRVHVRYADSAPHGYAGWTWTLAKGEPPEHADFARHTEVWTAVGACWTAPRSVAVSIELGAPLGRAHVRQVHPESGVVEGSRIAWTLPSVDTSKLADDDDGVWTSATWKAFTPDEEIAWLKERLDPKAAWADLCRLHLAFAYRAAGRVDEEVGVLEGMVAARARPFAHERGTANDLERGMYQRRPPEAYLADARRRQGDLAKATEAAKHAVVALRELIAAFPQDIELSSMYADLVDCATLAEDEATARDAAAKLEAIRKGS